MLRDQQKAEGSSLAVVLLGGKVAFCMSMCTVSTEFFGAHPKGP